MATMRFLPVCRSAGAERVHSIKAEQNASGAKLSIFHSCTFTDNMAAVGLKGGNTSVHDVLQPG